MGPVQLYAWHFMAYPYLPADFDEKYDSAWVTIPNALWDRKRTHGLYQEYIDQLAYADELGFDGVVLNEHHQNAYGLMPEPNIIAAALTQRTKRCKIAVIGNLIPIRLNPMQIAEEYAMLDSISGGRMICGFVVGGPQEAFNFDIPAPQARLQFWEGIDLVVRSWTEPGPFAHEGTYYPLRYVNPWPLPEQRPHPPVWIPGAFSIETVEETAKRGFSFFLSTRSKGASVVSASNRFKDAVQRHGQQYRPDRFGVLISVYVSENDRQAEAESEEAVWYYLRNCLKGHVRTKGRSLTFGIGAPNQTLRSREAFYESRPPGPARMLGDLDTWDELKEFGSVIVGGPERVREHLWSIIEEAHVGSLLIQFHMGNLEDRLARKSMRLFAEEVAPWLRERSGALFERHYPAEPVTAR
jgi:alkanesulfonate monooxygenase SsuD/methylene tetrahydromethanopterin reductase-like flavin-dependent oxidoreductase (luciferase family)